MPKLLLLLPLTNLLPSEFKQELTGRFLWLIKFLSVNSFFLGAKTSRSLQLCKITLLPLHFFFSLILSTAGEILAAVVKPHSEFCIFWNGCAYIYQVLTRPDLGPYANTAVNYHCQLYTNHATLNASQKMKIAWLHGRHFFPEGMGWFLSPISMMLVRFLLHLRKVSFAREKAWLYWETSFMYTSINNKICTGAKPAHAIKAYLSKMSRSSETHKSVGVFPSSLDGMLLHHNHVWPQPFISTCILVWGLAGGGGGVGNSHIKRTGVLVGNFEKNP